MTIKNHYSNKIKQFNNKLTYLRRKMVFQHLQSPWAKLHLVDMETLITWQWQFCKMRKEKGVITWQGHLGKMRKAQGNLKISEPQAIEYNVRGERTDEKDEDCSKLCEGDDNDVVRRQWRRRSAKGDDEKVSMFILGFLEF